MNTKLFWGIVLTIVAVFVLLMVKAITYVAEKSTPESTATQMNFPVLPEEMKDCKIYKIFSGEENRQLIVVRCPESTTSTTYRSGKTQKTVVHGFSSTVQLNRCTPNVEPQTMQQELNEEVK